jgi:hypothetical protein
MAQEEENPPKYFYKNTAKLSHGNKMRERSQSSTLRSKAGNRLLSYNILKFYRLKQSIIDKVTFSYKSSEIILLVTECTNMVFYNGPEAKVKYEIRSPKFIWAPLQLYYVIG